MTDKSSRGGIGGQGESNGKSARTNSDGDDLSHSDGDELSRTENSDPKLSPQQCREIIGLLARGASPSAACQKAGISDRDFLQAFQQDDAFRESIEQVNRILAQNVAAALYRAAMEGSVSAQTFWLRNNPPPGWEDPSEKTSHPDELDTLSDEELIDLAKSRGVALPVETEEAT